MPQRFAGRRLPAVVYAQPFELGIAGVLLISGIAMWADPVFVPASIKALHWPWALLFKVILLAGGVFMFAGLFRGKHRWSFTGEMAGMVMGATVFGSYSLGLLGLQNPAALVAVATNLLMALACSVKARAIWIEAHTRLDLIRELPLPAEPPAEADRGE